MSEELTKEQAVAAAIKLLSGNVDPDESTQGLSAHQLALSLLQCDNTVDVSCSVDLDTLADEEETTGARVFGYCPMGINDTKAPTILMDLESINSDGLEAIKRAEDQKAAKAWGKLSEPQRVVMRDIFQGNYESYRRKERYPPAITLQVLRRKGLVDDIQHNRLTVKGYDLVYQFNEGLR